MEKALKRILLIEDDESVRELIELMLSDSGYSVVSAPSRNDAIPLLEKSPEIILMDRVMPGMDCEPFLSAARVQCPYARIILMSGNYDRLEAERLGIPNFIPKPFSTKELLQAVN
jgi:DNA-binding response OmpR family regulator